MGGIKEQRTLALSGRQRARVCVCVCVFLYLLHTECQNTHFTSKVRIFWQVFGGITLGFKVEVNIGFRLGLAGVRGCVVHDAYASPHKDRNTSICVCGGLSLLPGCITMHVCVCVLLAA